VGTYSILHQLSKRVLCNFLTQYKEKPLYKHDCVNEYTLDVEPLSQIPPEDLVMIDDNEIQFCFTLNEIKNLKHNPYTGNLIPSTINAKHFRGYSHDVDSDSKKNILNKGSFKYYYENGLIDIKSRLPTQIIDIDRMDMLPIDKLLHILNFDDLDKLLKKTRQLRPILLMLFRKLISSKSFLIPQVNDFMTHLRQQSDTIYDNEFEDEDPTDFIYRDISTGSTNYKRRT